MRVCEERVRLNWTDRRVRCNASSVKASAFARAGFALGACDRLARATVSPSRAPPTQHTHPNARAPAPLQFLRARRLLPPTRASRRTFTGDNSPTRIRRRLSVRAHHTQARRPTAPLAHLCSRVTESNHGGRSDAPECVGRAQAGQHLPAQQPGALLRAGRRGGVAAGAGARRGVALFSLAPWRATVCPLLARQRRARCARRSVMLL